MFEARSINNSLVWERIQSFPNFNQPFSETLQLRSSRPTPFREFHRQHRCACDMTSATFVKTLLTSPLVSSSLKERGGIAADEASATFTRLRSSLDSNYSDGAHLAGGAAGISAACQFDHQRVSFLRAANTLATRTGEEDFVQLQLSRKEEQKEILCLHNHSWERFSWPDSTSRLEVTRCVTDKSWPSRKTRHFFHCWGRPTEAMAKQLLRSLICAVGFRTTSAKGRTFKLFPRPKRRRRNGHAACESNAHARA